MDWHAKRPLPAQQAVDREAYRLKHWPELPARFHTVQVLQSLSRMSLGPVTDDWFLLHTGLAADAAAQLLAVLRAQDALATMPLGVRTARTPARQASCVAAQQARRPRRAHRLGLKEIAIATLFYLAASSPESAQTSQLSNSTAPLTVPELPWHAG